MNAWIDEQLPEGLAPFFESFGVPSPHVRNIGFKSAADLEIFSALRLPGAVVVSKDEDFVDLVTRHGVPPQLLWLRVGNMTNRRLRELLGPVMQDVLTLLGMGEPIIEVHGGSRVARGTGT